MAVSYTHDIEFYYDGAFVRGSIEIKDEKSNVMIGEFSDPLPVETLDRLNEFIKFINTLATKDIKNISIIKKKET